jgi:uncharacterized protein
MDPLDIIKIYYPADSRAFDILVRHGRQVARKALQVAERIADLRPDLEFIAQAALLHDIGICLTHAPSLDCTGKYPYLCHGYLGRKLLEKENLGQHALVCERHVGVGICAEEIQRLKLPLPVRDMLPVSIEEQIICYADKFFSKNGERTDRQKTLAEVIDSLRPYGQDKLSRFEALHLRFGDT